MIQVVLTMDTLQLVPFEGTQLQRLEDFDASKFHIKELRIKDLHKNLCKKAPYFHARPDSPKRTSAAEPVEPNGGLSQSSTGACGADCETFEDGVASVPQGSTLRDPREAQREVSAAEEQPSNRTSKRKTRLPGKFRLDSNSFSDFPESYARYYRRSTSKSKAKHPRLKEKLDPVEPQFFEVPIEAHEVDLWRCDTAATACSGDRIGLGSSKVAESCPSTPSDRKTSTRPLKQIYYSPSSSQRRLETSKQCRVTVAYSECMEVSTDTDLGEGPSRAPMTSCTKWKHSSPVANTKEILPYGKRTLYNGFKGKTSSSGSKVNERKSKPLESKLQRGDNAPDGGSTEEMRPVRWRLDSPDASVERIVSTKKIRIRENKMEGKKSRVIESKINDKKSKIFESELKGSYSVPQASTEGTLPMRRKYRTSDPSKSKDKTYTTFESTGVEKERKTLESVSKRKHSAPNASGEDIIPLNWKLTKEKSPLESKWKEKSNRTNDSQLKEKARLKLSSHDLHGSTQQILPLKRKYSFCDASMEILPSERKVSPERKLKDNVSKAGVTKSKIKTSRITKSEMKKSSDRPHGNDGKPSRRVSIPIRKLKSGYTSEDGSSDLERDTDGLGISHPTFATEMKHSNVVKCFWMGIPANFGTRHMPDHDQFIVLQDCKGLKWEANYLARKKGLSGGWRRFALDHHLEMGDIVVFELVKPLKFLVHITKISGGISPTNPSYDQVRETPKKVLKPQASGGTKRVSSLESALFSNRIRVNKDAEGKLSRKKPRVAGDKKSGMMAPVVKPNRLFYPGALKKNRKDARKVTDHYEYQGAPLTSENSGDEGTLETKRGTSLPKLQRLSKREDDTRDSNAGIDVQELGLTVYKEPAFVSSLEPQKTGSFFVKPGSKKKLRRVSYFYSTDEDQGNSISA